MQVWCERFLRTSGPKRLPAAPWMKPSRPDRSAVWQRTRTRPVAGVEAITVPATTVATAVSANRVIALYSRELGRLAQLGERLPYKQEVGGSIPSPPTRQRHRRAACG